MIEILHIEGDHDGAQVLRDFLDKFADMRLAAQATTASDALERTQKQHIDVAVVTMSHGDFDGIEIIKQMRQTHSNVRIVIVTASDSADDIFAALDAGADAYVLKGKLSNALEMAIRSAKLGTVWLDPGIAKRILDSIEPTATGKKLTRVLPTGLMTIPLLPEEESVLQDVAGSSCTDGVCMVDLDFIRKLRRLSPSA